MVSARRAGARRASRSALALAAGPDRTAADIERGDGRTERVQVVVAHPDHTGSELEAARRQLPDPIGGEVPHRQRPAVVAHGRPPAAPRSHRTSDAAAPSVAVGAQGVGQPGVPEQFTVQQQPTGRHPPRASTRRGRRRESSPARCRAAARHARAGNGGAGLGEFDRRRDDVGPRAAARAADAAPPPRPAYPAPPPSDRPWCTGPATPLNDTSMDCAPGPAPCRRDPVRRRRSRGTRPAGGRVVDGGEATAAEPGEDRLGHTAGQHHRRHRVGGRPATLEHQQTGPGGVRMTGADTGRKSVDAEHRRRLVGRPAVRSTRAGSPSRRAADQLAGQRRRPGAPSLSSQIRASAPSGPVPVAAALGHRPGLLAGLEPGRLHQQGAGGSRSALRSNRPTMRSPTRSGNT